MLLNKIEIFLSSILTEKDRFQIVTLKIVLELILKIEESRIDNSRSEFYEQNGNYELRLYSNREENCNLFISFLQDNIVDIQLNRGGEYLYLQRHQSEEDLNNLDSTMRDILFFPILETLTFCEDKLIKAAYKVNHNFNNIISQNEYIMSFGSCLPWKSKRIERKEYAPWIDKEYLLSYVR